MISTEQFLVVKISVPRHMINNLKKAMFLNIPTFVQLSLTGDEYEFGFTSEDDVWLFKDIVAANQLTNNIL